MTDAVTLDISEVAGNFRIFRVALLVVDGLIIPAERPSPLEAFVADTTAQISKNLAGVDLADVAELKAWRQAYRAFGVKKTSYRSSVERLLKNLQRGTGLPRVNALVDAYNAVSALYRMPIGADDLERVTSPLAFRYARPSDTFIALGDPEGKADPPNAGEIVYADAEKCLCRRWNWYQDARSAIGPRTTSAVLTVQSLSDDDTRLPRAVAQLVDLIVECGGARVNWSMARADAPRVSVRLP